MGDKAIATSGPGITLNISKEFQNILAQIARQVMIHRPLNVYRFLADFLEAELDRRTLLEIQAQSKFQPTKTIS